MGWKHGLSGLVAAVGWLGLEGEAFALESSCMTANGICEVSNVPDDSGSCECADGGAGGFGGGNEWAAYNQAQMDMVCLETVEAFCGPPPPPDGVPCGSVLGECLIDNEPDNLSCECAGGLGGGFGGGNEWDGLSDDELADVCLEQLDLFCGAPPDPEWLCESDLGGCSIDISEDGVFVTCGCDDGGAFYPGDPEWADLDEDDLLEVCFGELDATCGVGAETETDTDTTDTTDSESDTTAGTSDDTTTTEGTTEGTTDGESDTTAPAEDSSGGSGDTTATTDTMTAGESSTAGESMTEGESMTAASGEESSSTGATAGAEGGNTGGCSCTTDDSESDLGGLLALLGLVGWRMRRRRVRQAA